MKYRIYVIEDDENIRNLICVALENFGYCASGFETAEEALDNLSALLRRGREAQREYPAMFVFDWMLPGMDGMAAIRKIREMPDFSAAPVLMLTAKDREMDIVQGLDNGADDYMTKPFGILELSARVRNLLKLVLKCMCCTDIREISPGSLNIGMIPSHARLFQTVEIFL